MTHLSAVLAKEGEKSNLLMKNTFPSEMNGKMAQQKATQMTKTSHKLTGNLSASVSLISSPALIGSCGITRVRLKSRHARMTAQASENTQVVAATNKAVPSASGPDLVSLIALQIGVITIKLTVEPLFMSIKIYQNAVDFGIKADVYKTSNAELKTKDQV